MSAFIFYLIRMSYIHLSKIPLTLSEYGKNHFDEMFMMHPEDRGKVILQTGEIQVHRWLKSYLKTPAHDPCTGKSFMFSGIDGSNNEDFPAIFKPFLDFVKTIDPAYNQVSINWYQDGNDYVAMHSDCENKFKENASICISLGELHF